MTPVDQAIARVADLLDAQRTALISADFAALDRLVHDLEQSILTLSSLRPAQGRLANIRDAAARNGRLIAAAQRGARAARDLLVAKPTQVLTTYDRTGRRTPSAPESGQLLSRR